MKNKIPGKIAWRSPSNIALVKYWGKKPVQLPANPSLSMTLRKSCTEMILEYWPAEERMDSPFLEFLFEGKAHEEFAGRITSFLQALSSDYPVIKEYKFRINSHNTFPHSAGIASSASSMSALGLCLAELTGTPSHASNFFRKASGISRLASGSACRSVFGGYVLWGQCEQIHGSSDEYAVPLPYEPHPLFADMNDAILIVSSNQKKVSSRTGHSLMEDHPYAGSRYEMATRNIADIMDAIKTGDLDKFMKISESEALNLHALMMTSSQPYLLCEPQTLQVIQAIWEFRKSSHVPVCFSMDAGPNIHMLYPAEYETRVKEWIVSELAGFCENGHWIDDKIGNGPVKVT